MHTDFVAQVSVLTSLANLMRDAGRGEIVVFSSVAGVRVRRANYVYGSAKAGLTAYLSGLRARMVKVGVQVTTIKPGFVDTAMTRGKPGMFLVAKPEVAAEGIVRAIAKGRDSAYVPGF